MGLYNKIHYYFGNGKGKTSAAVGAAVRMAGSGGRVVFCQFLKNGNSSEITVLNSVENIECMADDEPMGFVWNMNREEKSAATVSAQRLFAKRTEAGKQAQMIIFDELTDAVDCGFLDKDYVISTLKKLAAGAEVIVTGHSQDRDFIDIADYVSEIKSIKHPYENGVKARKGIEF